VRLSGLCSRKIFWLLFAASLILALWSFAVPIFEAPDEPHHWQNAEYIHAYWKLPPYNQAFVEGNQAPLYYLLVSPFSIHSSVPPLKAAVEDGKMGPSCPPRFYENCPSDLRNYWPIRIVRLITALISVATVLFTALAATEATANPDIGILAGSLVAFLPQFSFRGSTVNNDAMVACSCAAATWYLVRFTRASESRTAMWCAVACTLAFLSKINGIVVSIGFIAYILILRLPWIECLQRMKFLFIGLVVVSPWLFRNRLLYGDFLAQSIMPRVVPVLVDRKPLTAPYFYTMFPNALWRSFIGVFGWGNIALPLLMYRIYLLLTTIAFVGLMCGLIQRKIDRKLCAVLLLILFLTIAATIQLNLTFTQPQGRYLFPALTATMVLCAVGLGALPKWRGVATYGVIALLGFLNMYALIMVVYPAYWIPTQVSLQIDSDASAKLTKISPYIPLTPGHSFTQSFIAKHNNLSAVEIEFTNGGHPVNSGDVVLHLKAALTAATDIANISIPASLMRRCCAYMRLSFHPIMGSKDKIYYVSIETVHVSPTAEVTVFVGDEDLGANGSLYVDNRPQAKSTLFRTYYEPRLEPCPKCLCKFSGSK